MSIDWKVKLYRNPEIPLPSVVKLDLDDAPFRALEGWAADMDLFLVHASTGTEIGCQLNRSAMSAAPEGVRTEFSLYLLLHEWPSDDEEHVLSFGKKPKKDSVLQDRVYNPYKNTSGVIVDRQEENARVAVSIKGALFTRYLYSPFAAKPYYYPLIGPGGKTLVQDAPDDHLHHHGLWWGHDDVNGHKLYHEFRGEGRQVHRKFLACYGGSVFGQITALIDWQDEHGHLLFSETRSVRIYNLPREARYIDLCTELHAVNGDIHFGATKEGGFPFIRVNEQINGHHTGLLTAAGGIQREEDIFGKVTEWVDYSGTIFKDTKAGITVFSHPDNETYASQWFVRDYGPFTPANFHFCGGKLLPEGDTIRMKHRLYIHQGDVFTGKVKERYDEYVRPVRIDLI